jgi:hypothetical protein
MYAFAQRGKTTQPSFSSSSTPTRTHSKQNREANPILQLQRTIGNQAVLRRLQGTQGPKTDPGISRPDFGEISSRMPSQYHAFEFTRPGNVVVNSPADFVSVEGETPNEPYIDQAAAPAPPAPAPGPVVAPVPAGPAKPTDLLQLLTAWAPGPDKYGFQLKFRCRSTSGDVHDLQKQAPNLLWREHVTYTRNDFATRINPPNPTITPPAGVSFAAAHTTRLGPNLLEFNHTTDTHWMPTSAVRSGDFRPAGPPPPPGFIGPLQPPLPAVMESRQLYQFSQNAGASWHYLDGEYILRRTLFNEAGALKFKTQKIGVHTTTELYKP